MKKLIKKLLRENLLNEKLTEVDEDVDFIYDKYFKEDINEIQRTGVVTENMFSTNKLNTGDLTSKSSVEAHKLNPCTIHINNFDLVTDNFYNPNEQIISISINDDAFKYALRYGGNIQKAKSWLNDNQQKQFENEFTEDKIKGSINHELVHWIDDTLHNRHIKNRLNRAQELGSKNFNNEPINMHYVEIQAQIHNIKQAKRKYQDIWDELSFKELISFVPSLKTIYSQLNNPYMGDNKLKKWLKKLKTRMYREGLLGKNMTNN